MKKNIYLLILLAFFALPCKAQTPMAVPHGSFEQWDSHSGYSISFMMASIPIFDSYATPTGWNYLSYPVNESISVFGNNVSISTSIPLILAEETTTAVPAGNKAAKLESFMLSDVVSPAAYALMSSNLDSTLTQTVFPSILCNGAVNLDNFMPLVSTLLSNLDSAAQLLTALDTVDVNHLITGGMALGTFEPTRLTGSYKYQAAGSVDNGGVVILGTRYNNTTHRRDVVGGGANIALTNAANYTPFTVNYQSLHELLPSEPEQAADSLIILILSSASTTMQQGSTLCIDNLVLWHDTLIGPADTCAAIVGLTATPDIHEAAINWSTTGTVAGYELEYGAAGFTQGTGTLVTLTNNTYSLSNLDANSSYDVYVRALCNDSIYGDWSMLHFTTLPDTCASVLDLVIASIVFDAFPQYVLEWWQTSQPDHWEVVYGLQGTDVEQGTVVTTNENSFAIYELEQAGALAPNTRYYFGVRSVCEDSVYGEWEFVEYLTPCAQVESLVVWDDSVTVTSDNQLEGYRATWTDTNNTRWYVSVGNPSNSIPDHWNPGEEVSEPIWHLPKLMPNRQYYVELVPYCGEDNSGELEWILFTTTTIGIQQVQVLNLSVYPNPASGSCFVNLSSDEPALLELFSYDGRLLQTVQSHGGDIQLELPSQGVFLLQATTPSGKVTRKIINK